MTDREMLELATQFEVMPEVYPVYGRVCGGITIQRRAQRDGPALWAVVLRNHWTLNTAGEWERELRPSSRDDDYLERNRFPTLEAAWDAALPMAEAEINEAVRIQTQTDAKLMDLAQRARRGEFKRAAR